MGTRPVARVSGRTYGSAGDCGLWPQWRRVDHASCHRDCCGGSEPRRLLLDAFALLGRLQADATRHSGPARVHPAGGGCQYLGGTFLQDPLFGERARAGRRFFGDLHPEQVPNGNYSCADYPQSRRFLDDHRSQSGIRGTAASRSAAEGFRQSRAQAKEAEAAWRCSLRWLAIPGSRCRASARIIVPNPLIACTAASRGKL